MLINKSEFVDKLKFVRSFVGANGPMQLAKAEITEDSLVLSAMNLATYVRVPVFVIMEKDDPCEFLFDGNKVETLVKTLDDGDVKITVGQRLYIKQGSTKRSWEIADVEGYPNPPKIGEAMETVVDFEELRNAVSSVSFPIGESNKEYLTGVCITPQMVLAASETRAVGHKLDTGIPDTVLVDPVFITVLKGLNFDDVGTATFIGAGNWVGITVGDYEARIATKSVVPYPVDSVQKMVLSALSDMSNTAILDRGEVTKQLTTAGVYSKVAKSAMENYALYIKSDDGRLVFSMNTSAGIMDDTLPFDILGSFDVAVDADTLKSAISSAPNGEMVLGNNNDTVICLRVDDIWGYAQAQLVVK